MNKIILYIAISEDGFVADINGNVEWLPQPQNNSDLEAFGYNNLMSRIDTIVMGSKSFKQILSFGSWSWTCKHSYIFTSQAIENNLSCVTLTKDTPIQFTRKIRKRKTGKDIWLLGGAMLAKSFSLANLIDEVILTVIPTNLGSGIPLGLSLNAFDLKTEKLLMNGIVQKIYLKKNYGSAASVERKG